MYGLQKEIASITRIKAVGLNTNVFFPPHWKIKNNKCRQNIWLHYFKETNKMKQNKFPFISWPNFSTSPVADSDGSSGDLALTHARTSQRHWDEILSCLFNGTCRAAGDTPGRIEWHSCKKLSCQQVRHQDTRTHTWATVKLYTPSLFTSRQLCARTRCVQHTPSVRGRKYGKKQSRNNKTFLWPFG